MALDYDPNQSGSGLDRFRRACCGVVGLGPFICAITILLFTPACQNREIEAQTEAASALAMLDQNRLAEARMAINRALLLQDDVPDYHLAKGRIELAAGSNSAAYDAYFDALGLQPNNFEALQAVSQLGLQTGNINASLKATDTLILLNPSDTTALITRGVHALISSRLDEADEYAGRALAINAFSDEALILRSRILYLKGQNEDALDLLEDRSSEREDSVGVHLTRLELYRASRNPKGMATQFNALRKMGHKPWELVVDEANFLFKTGRRDAALDLTTDLLVSDDPGQEARESIEALWTIWEISDLSDETIAMIATKGSKSVRYDVAVFLARHLAVASALKLSSTLEGHDRSSVQAFIAMRQGRHSDAGRLIAQVLETDKTHCLGLEVRAQISLAAGKLRQSLSDAQQLAIQCPNELAGWQMAAESYSKLRDPDNARRILGEGAEANPQNIDYVSHHTTWLRSNGRQREALAVARRFTRDAPAIVQGWNLYRQLCEDFSDPCAAEARRGLTDAQTRYWIDYAPGESTPPGLFGRLKGI